MLTQLPILDTPEAFFRANIHHFLPDYPSRDYAACYQAVCARQRQAAGDYRQISPEQVVDLCGSLHHWIERIRTCPGIIATYHTGSYRLLSLCLAVAGLPLALLVSADVAARERETMIQRQLVLTGAATHPLPLVILEAEDPLILRRTCRLMQQGYLVVMYVDGNSGSPMGANNHLLTLPFLSGHLAVRKGIPLLSTLAGVPVYPIACRWADGQAGQSCFVTGSPIELLAGESRDDYARRTMQQLYRFLEDVLAPDPATWECWRYLHHWVPRTGSTDRDESWLSGANQLTDAIGTGRLQVFRKDDRIYLLDAKDYRSYPLETF